MTETRPRQNRVTPTGAIVASPDRGWFMGNRGRLHRGPGAQTAGDPVIWLRQTDRWICCRCDFARPGAPLPHDAPGRAYTPLFFWDEAVALAAGHRPCALCRPACARRFVRAFNLATGRPADQRTRLPEIDARLKQDRNAADPERGRPRYAEAAPHQRRFSAAPRDLPSGTFLWTGDTGPALLREARLLPWSTNGYGPARTIAPDTPVSVLTPAITVAILRAGYEPAVRLDPAAAAPD